MKCHTTRYSMILYFHIKDKTKYCDMILTLNSNLGDDTTAKFEGWL